VHWNDLEARRRRTTTITDVVTAAVEVHHDASGVPTTTIVQGPVVPTSTETSGAGSVRALSALGALAVVAAVIQNV
jgi:hypothetical protein